MRRLLTRPLAAAVAASVLLVAAGCGSDDDRSDAPPKTLLGEAAAKKIDSAEVALTLRSDIEGFPILGSRISLTGGGPFVANGPDSLPTFDWRMRLRGGDDTFPMRVSAVDGKLYVDFLGQYYVADDELTEDLGLDGGDGRPRAASLAELGLDPERWLTRVQVEDGEEIGGDSTRVITGRAVERSVIEDLLALVDYDQLAESGAGLGELPEVEDDDLDRAAESVDRAEVEVNVDDEGYPRRVYAKLHFTMPKDVKKAAFEEGTILFELVLEQVGDVEVDVEPPFQPEPLSDLIDFARSVFSIDEPSDLWTQP